MRELGPMESLSTVSGQAGARQVYIQNSVHVVILLRVNASASSPDTYLILVARTVGASSHFQVTLARKAAAGVHSRRPMERNKASEATARLHSSNDERSHWPRPCSRKAGRRPGAGKGGGRREIYTVLWRHWCDDDSVSVRKVCPPVAGLQNQGPVP